MGTLLYEPLGVDAFLISAAITGPCGAYELQSEHAMACNP